jgi:hypothetical protein
MGKVFLDANALLSILALHLHLYEGNERAAPPREQGPRLEDPAPTPRSFGVPRAPPQNCHNLSALPPDPRCGAAKDAA